MFLYALWNFPLTNKSLVEYKAAVSYPINRLTKHCLNHKQATKMNYEKLLGSKVFKTPQSSSSLSLRAYWFIFGCVINYSFL